MPVQRYVQRARQIPSIVLVPFTTVVKLLLKILILLQIFSCEIINLKLYLPVFTDTTLRVSEAEETIRNLNTQLTGNFLHDFMYNSTKENLIGNMFHFQQ